MPPVCLRGHGERMCGAEGGRPDALGGLELKVGGSGPCRLGLRELRQTGSGSDVPSRKDLSAGQADSLYNTKTKRPRGRRPDAAPPSHHCIHSTLRGAGPRGGSWACFPGQALQPRGPGAWEAHLSSPSRVYAGGPALGPDALPSQHPEHPEAKRETPPPLSSLFYRRP